MLMNLNKDETIRKSIKNQLHKKYFTYMKMRNLPLQLKSSEELPQRDRIKKILSLNNHTEFELLRLECLGRRGRGRSFRGALGRGQFFNDRRGEAVMIHRQVPGPSDRRRSDNFFRRVSVILKVRDSS